MLQAFIEACKVTGHTAMRNTIPEEGQEADNSAGLPEARVFSPGLPKNSLGIWPAALVLSGLRYRSAAGSSSNDCHRTSLQEPRRRSRCLLEDCPE